MPSFIHRLKVPDHQVGELDPGPVGPLLETMFALNFSVS